MVRIFCPNLLCVPHKLSDRLSALPAEAPRPGVKLEAIPEYPMTVDRPQPFGRWYVVVRGAYVGVFPTAYVYLSYVTFSSNDRFLPSEIADHATKGVKYSQQYRRASQMEAVELFNEYLADDEIAVLPR